MNPIHRPKRARRASALLVSALAAALALAACGSSTSSAGTSSSTNAASGTSAASATPAAASNTTAGSSGSSTLSISGVGAIPVDQSLASQLPSQFKPLVFVFAPPYPPFEQFVNGTHLEGSNVDFANAIAATLGTQAKNETTTAFTAEVPGIQSGKYDVIGDTIGDEGAARIKVVNFIDYVRSPGFILATTAANPDHITSWADLCGKGLAGESGDIITNLIPTIDKDFCTSKGKPAIQLHDFPSQSDARLALLSGKDAALTSNAFAFLGNTNKGQQLKEIIDPKEVAIANAAGLGGPAYFGLVTAKSQPLLSKLVLEAVQKLASEGLYQKIFAKWGLSKYLVNPPLYNHPLTKVQATSQ